MRNGKKSVKNYLPIREMPPRALLGEIAERLGTSEGGARVVLHRGQKALRDLLGRACTLDFADEIPCARR